MTPTLPIDYGFVLLVGAVLSALLTEAPRTPALARIVGLGRRIGEGVTAGLPWIRSRSRNVRGAIAIMLLLVARALLGSAASALVGAGSG